MSNTTLEVLQLSPNTEKKKLDFYFRKSVSSEEDDADERLDSKVNKAC